MNAGRALDALVHTKVMDGESVEDVKWLNSPYTLEIVPAYSQDIAAAWQVLEKFGASYSVAIVQHLFGDGIRYDVAIDRVDEDGYGIQCIGSARATSAPLAICLAALKVVGYEQ